jgi:hypothetical protein
VSEPDPEDDGRAAGPSGRSATFEEIIAKERAAGWDPKVPAVPSDLSALTEPFPEPSLPAPSPPAEASDANDDEHYVPPEPPPIPRIGLNTSIGLALISLGVVLLVVPGVFGLGYGAGLPLGLTGLALGLGWLIHHAVRTNSSDEKDDGSAV